MNCLKCLLISFRYIFFLKNIFCYQTFDLLPILKYDGICKKKPYQIIAPRLRNAVLQAREEAEESLKHLVTRIRNSEGVGSTRWRRSGAIQLEPGTPGIDGCSVTAPSLSTETGAADLRRITSILALTRALHSLPGSVLTSEIRQVRGVG
jgi:hypothetical protein